MHFGNILEKCQGKQEGRMAEEIFMKNKIME